MTNEEIIREIRNLADKHKYDSVLTFGTNYHMAFTDIANHIEEQAEENTKLKAEINRLIGKSGMYRDMADSFCNSNIKLKAEIEQWQSTNLKLTCELTRVECENHQLKAELKKAMPYEFGQKLYSIETWEDTGDCTIFEYTFDGVEADGIRLIYQGNKEDVCVFSLDEIGVNIFESMDEAEEVLKGGAE